MNRNKHFKREKKLRSLITELNNLRDISYEYTRSYSRYRLEEKDVHPQVLSRINQIKDILEQEFHNQWNHYGAAPHWYRNKLNRKQRHQMKNKIRNWVLNEDSDLVFEDNFKDAGWYW